MIGDSTRPRYASVLCNLVATRKAKSTPRMLTPYRINVFATSTKTMGKGKRQKTKTTGYGNMGWTPVQHAWDAGRLPSAGSFLWPGMKAVRDAAMAFLALPETHQVQILTDQSRKVWLFNKHADGRITGYCPDSF